MTSDDELFASALERPPAERAAFLDAACGADPERRARLAELLAAHDAAASFLTSPLTPGGPLPPAEKSGDVIGRYRLVEKLGEGGCGVVWLAEQSEPVKRRVALKVIKLGMDTKEVIARFEAERQALALMDHPNIAKVFDAGTTATGRPFFVMELVRGVPITRYCDEAQFSTERRLQLFIQVCQAIQHAHQKGVIHRDIKPSNILVTQHDDVAVPKVIDFGIAKATQGRLTDATVYTAFAQFIGTPAYMSPEQAEFNALDVDTRSDIYSLGVLLYELLAGQPPFDPRSLVAGGLDEIRKIIREVEPPRPSARLGTLAAGERDTRARQRGIAPAQLALAVRGDLDWIVMKALEKNRTRRYESASAFAGDVQRFLQHEPVSARPPSTAYLLGKLIRRHRFGFAATVIIAVVLIAGGSVSRWQAVRAKQAEHAAVEAQLVARRGEEEQRRLRAVESAQRQRAEAAELAVRRQAYVADLNLVQQALAEDNLARAQSLLDRQRPRPGEPDLRDWEWRYLWQFARSDARAIVATKPDTTINSVAVSADGTWLAAGEVNYGGLSVWNLRTKEEIRIPAGRSGVKVAFSPREPLLAIAVFTEEKPYCRVWLWDLPTRRVVRELVLGPDGYGSGLYFSADGQTLVTSRNSPANEITLWRVADGAKLAAFPVRAGSMDVRFMSFAVTRDLSLAAYRLDRKIYVLDLATGRERWSAIATNENILSLAFSPDGRLLASGSGWTEPTIRLWDTATGAEVGRLEGHRRSVLSLLFLPGGQLLASASGDQTVRIWDVAERRLVRTLRGHRSEVDTLALFPDGRTLATGSKDGTVRLWDAFTDPVAGAFLQFPGGPTPGASRFSAASDALVYVDFAGRVVERRGRNFAEVRTLLDPNPDEPRPSPTSNNDSERPLTTPVSSEDPSVVAPHAPLVALKRGRDPNHIRVWNWETQTLVRELALPEGGVGFVPIGFSPDASKLYLGLRPGGNSVSLVEHDLANGRRLREWPLPASAPWPALSPDGKYFAVASSPGRFLRVTGAAEEPAAWIRTELATGRQTALPGNTRESGTAGATFSADGRYFAGGSAQGFMDLLDAQTWQRVATLSGVMAGMYLPAFSPEGTRLAVGSSGSETVTIWDLKTFERLLTLPSTTAVVGVIGFSPDGNVLAARSTGGGMDRTSSARGTLFLWRAPSWAEIAAAEKADAR